MPPRMPLGTNRTSPAPTVAARLQTVTLPVNAMREDLLNVGVSSLMDSKAATDMLEKQKVSIATEPHIVTTLSTALLHIIQSKGKRSSFLYDSVHTVAILLTEISTEKKPR